MNTKCLETPRLITSARPGSPIGECIIEAVMLSATERRNVSFTHNDSLYSVSFNDLMLVAECTQNTQHPQTPKGAA